MVYMVSPMASPLLNLRLDVGVPAEEADHQVDLSPMKADTSEVWHH
jgi:hypothetical protein